ncbi:MAG TPA: hypothetical protein VGD59_02900 [Acidisarcina sp.]
MSVQHQFKAIFKGDLYRRLSLLTAINAIAACALMLPSLSTAQSAPTSISVGTNVKLTNVKRLGINLGAQAFYDSELLLRNIMVRNPGFEGELWQSILHCKTVTATSCTDDDPYTAWPANFFADAKAEFVTGGATGATATVISSTAANYATGIGSTLVFASAPGGIVAPGDYVVVRMHVPGNAQAGWWTYGDGGATFSTEFKDLSPNSPGLQALRVDASGPNGFATLSSYADTCPQPFIQMNGHYTLSFRAKGVGGNNMVGISLNRNAAGGQSRFFNQTVSLGTSWQDYSYSFQGVDAPNGGGIALTFQLVGSAMLIDDVAVTADAGSDNPTAYRDEVVSTLQALHPGILRFMDAGTSFGSTLDNMLAPSFARERAGYSAWTTESDDIPMGLHDFLVLCQTIGAEPWYTFPAGSTTQEMSNLMDYLGGSTSTAYGAKRAALGQSAPWTSVFPIIHLEFGNEVWNGGFSGAAFLDGTSYGKRAGVIFGVARSSPSYSSKSFDLIVDGWESVPYWSSQVLAASSNYDTIDAAPYLFNSLNDTSSVENIFGPMLAQPELMDSTIYGSMYQQAGVAALAKRPAHLAVYESNLSTTAGSASQAAINQTVPSLGAGLTATEHMLLMMRDLGVTNQAMFALGGYSSPFRGSTSSSGNNTQLWGVVVDMGVTNRLRPTYLTEQLANAAILPTMLSTTQGGANPTWNQPYSTNDNVQLSGAHYLQSFAFTDGAKLNLILFNLHRTNALPVVLSGPNAPAGNGTITTLSAASITASNEQSQLVAPAVTSQTLQAGTTLTLPPYSMTVISGNAPSPGVSSVTVACAATTLVVGASTTCSGTVNGTGLFNSGVSWQASQGTITSSGLYTAPTSLASNGTTILTATSLADGSKSGTAAINLSSSKVTSLSVSCPVASMPLNGSTSCAATVQGIGNFSSGVTWSSSSGSVDNNGNLNAPAAGTSVTVQAVSIQDPTKYAIKSLTLTDPSLSSTPPSNPLQLYGLKTATGYDYAVIRWLITTPTRNSVKYGPTSSYGLVMPATSPTGAPSFTVHGLTPGTKYYFQLISTFPNGQTATLAISLTTKK